MDMFTYSICEKKYLFGANLAPEFKIVCLKLVHISNRISRIQWWSSLFVSSTEKKQHFLAKLYQNIKIVGLSGNLVHRPIWLCRINGGIQFFHFLTEIPFWETLVQKFKTVILSWNLLPRLICVCRIQWRCSLFLFWTGNTFFGQTRSESPKLSV